jgi:hypothetical protein
MCHKIIVICKNSYYKSFFNDNSSYYYYIKKKKEKFMHNKAYIKAIIIGVGASLAVTVLVSTGIALGKAPFNIPPVAAFLKSIGIPAKPFGLILHLIYGSIACVGLIYIFKDKTQLKHGLILACSMWLMMMLVYSPVIGWGIFGFNAPNHELAQTDSLYIGSPVKYTFITFIVHMIYGFIIGLAPGKFITEEEFNQSSNKQ